MTACQCSFRSDPDIFDGDLSGFGGPAAARRCVLRCGRDPELPANASWTPASLNACCTCSYSCSVFNSATFSIAMVRFAASVLVPFWEPSNQYFMWPASRNSCVCASSVFAKFTCLLSGAGKMISKRYKNRKTPN